MRAFVSLVLALTPLAAAACVLAQQPPQNLVGTLAFETPALSGWSGGPRETLSTDTLVVHGGRAAGRIERSQTLVGSDVSSFTLSVPRTFGGQTLQLRGWLRTEDVEGFAGLWLRQDGVSGPVQFDNMQRRGLAGTTEWTQYTVTLPLDDRARTVYMGALLGGTGTVWIDDLELLVDGRPASEAPPFAAPVAPLELDTEFDGGSRISARALSPEDVDHLSLLGRVWGFVKYHHPRVRAGEVNWDYELFRVLPEVLAADDAGLAQAAMGEWLAELGDPPPCDPCAAPLVDSHLIPDIGWIGDRALLGGPLSERLELIHARRPANAEHHYVSSMRGVGNPDLGNETTYPQLPFPDAGYRLLALYRYWNIIEYWFPYRDLITASWEDVLAEFVPRMFGAAVLDDYGLALLELIARIEDTHGAVAGSVDLQPPRGSAALPVVVRFVEDRPVVIGYSHADLGPASGVRVGDVIEAIDGRPIEALVAEWRPFYSASNEPARRLRIATNLTNGAPGPVRIVGSRADGAFELEVDRVPRSHLDARAYTTGDLPGPALQMLSEDVAYLKLSSVVAADAAEYVRRAGDAEVLVVDIRNYPSEFVPFALGQHLITEPTPFARFTVPDLENPGAFRWTSPVVIEPREPHFGGRVVVLVNELSISQSEYTAMALRAGPNAMVVGSTTAGADGNISPIPLPGAQRSAISGIGVFYPDRSPTQQIGIVPDLVVRPTIEGVRAGRDEVLEAGVSAALGRAWRLDGSSWPR